MIIRRGYGQLLAVFIVGLSWAGLALTAVPVNEQPVVTMLHYEEQEAGTDVYPVRILVYDKHLRIDDGEDQGDFVLLDRVTQRLYSVNHDEKNILVVDYRAAEVTLPVDLQLTEVESIDADAPRIQSRQLLNRQLWANGTVCLQVVAVPGLLDAAVVGLAEYARVLGTRQLHSLETVPASMQTPCFLSRYAYAPARHLQHGLPVEEWDGKGYRRTLLDYREAVPVSPALFRLPAGYDEFSLD